MLLFTVQMNKENMMQSYNNNRNHKMRIHPENSNVGAASNSTPSNDLRE